MYGLSYIQQSITDICRINNIECQQSHDVIKGVYNFKFKKDDVMLLWGISELDLLYIPYTLIILEFERVIKPFLQPLL